MQKASLIALSLGLCFTGSPSEARFLFEGLQPFSVRACADVTPFSDPVVTRQGGPSSIEGTPSAFNDAGVPRFMTFPCSDTRIQGKAPAPSRQRRHVPQK